MTNSSRSPIRGATFCRYCIVREGIKGSQIKSRNAVCSLCEGALSNLSKIVAVIRRETASYEFSTFLVGASLPQSILDKEDELRSRLKIKGKENIKSQITKIISKKLATETKRKVDYSRPDVTILVSLIDNMVTITSRSIWLSARYRKMHRGIPQRASVCKVCNGLGCAECDYSGKKGASVQAIAESYFAKIFEAEACNFVWLGSEDEMSLVEGSGRPFYVEVLRPKKRSVFKFKRPQKRSKVFRISDGVEISGIEVLNSKPTEIPQFEITARINLKRKDESSDISINLEAIHTKFSEVFVNVRLSRKYRTVKRKIHSIEGHIAEGGLTASLVLNCEGGIPLKKFVSGEDGTVEPNISSLLIPYELDSIMPFDIMDVRIKKAETKKVSKVSVSDIGQEVANGVEPEVDQSIAALL
ncbi:MAG: hypothetical protein JRN15_14490 [Nitrososphaerota archaeon]|nr:hypothetical protein [Nitrososphaerota archaeon]